MQLSFGQEPEELNVKVAGDVEGGQSDVGLLPPGQPGEEVLAVVGDRQPPAGPPHLDAEHLDGVHVQGGVTILWLYY